MTDVPSPVTVEYDADSAVYRARHEFGGPLDLAATVVLAVEAVARAEDDHPAGVLFDAVDPDALAGLFEPTAQAERNRGRLEFPMGGYEVTVTADGRIAVDPSLRGPSPGSAEPTRERWAIRGPEPLEEPWYAWSDRGPDSE